MFYQSIRRRDELSDYETSTMAIEEHPEEGSWKIRHLNYPGNVVQSIFRRERGLQCPRTFQSDIIDSKLQFPKVTKAVSFLDNYDRTAYTNSEIVILKPGNKSIIACWKADHQSYFVGVLNNEIVDTEYGMTCTKVTLPKFSITDLCESNPGRIKILMALNNQNCVGNIALLKISRAQQLDRFRFDYQSPIWCCASSHKHSYFSVGLQNRVLVYSTTDLVAFNIAVPGNVHSMHHDFARNIIYSGLHTGIVSINDPRVKKSVSAFRVGQTVVNEVLASKTGDFVICSDKDDTLSRIETRMAWREIVRYEEHQSTKSKSSVHFSEISRFICSTGHDNITRLWGLEDGGLPKYCISPDERNDHQTAACIVEAGRRSLIYHVSLTKFRIFEL